MSESAGLVFMAVLVADAAAVALLLAREGAARLRKRAAERARKVALAIVGGSDRGAKLEAADLRFLKRRRWLFLKECAALFDSILPSDEGRVALSAALAGAGIDLVLVRELNAASRWRRIRAAAYLPFVPTRAARVSLVRALERERSPWVKLFAASALSEMGETGAIPTLIDSLAGQPPRYQRALRSLLAEFGDELAPSIPLLMERREREIQLLLIHLAERCCSGQMMGYLLRKVEEGDLEIAREAFRVLCTRYASRIDHAHFLRHEDFVIRNLAAESLGALPTTHSLALLFEHLGDRLMRKSVAAAISGILRARPQHLQSVLLRFLNESDPSARATLVGVFARFSGYLMQKLATADAPVAARLLRQVLRQGHVAAVVNFLNQNADPVIERRALRILQAAVRKDARLSARLARHLDPRLRDALGIAPAPVPGTGGRAETANVPLLAALLAAGVLLLPAVCGMSELLSAGPFEWQGLLQRFAVAFALYTGALNGSYLVLLAASFAGVRAQARFEDLLRLPFLFKEDVLPSVSVVSPAYNEEASIIESVCSLLNLNYPDYEVIVVNDGSTDGTLQKLIDYFDMEPTDPLVRRYLATQEIRGIYASKRYPELLVVDKDNGGKADSLNAGINVARKEYFAAIDADSMLERDALLRLAAKFLMSDVEVVGAGGNILPVNGCTVRRGALLRTAIPKDALGRFQTTEYLRAFLAGRVGWAALGSLLIISGAFGLFHRRKVINVRGYLTRSEEYGKDTVGEDMELVVRLARNLRDSGSRGSIQYAYDANCWTEVPQSMRVLARQRDRWHRGLLDIVSFHAGMIGNPRYGRAGTIGLPYFVLFEVLGPWVEVEGFLAFIASIALGAIGPSLVLLALTASVLLGILASICALVIAEYRRRYFSLADKMILLLYVVAESLGFRQLMNLLRLRAHIRILGRRGGWGEMQRRGLRSAPLAA